MSGRESILVVEDDRMMLNLYEEILRENYDVTSVFYDHRETRIPTEKFGGAILDGLNGDWRIVAKNIKVDPRGIFIISSDYNFVQEAIKDGFRAIDKGNLNFDKLERILE